MFKKNGMYDTFLNVNKRLSLASMVGKKTLSDLNSEKWHREYKNLNELKKWAYAQLHILVR